MNLHDESTHNETLTWSSSHFFRADANYWEIDSSLLRHVADRWLYWQDMQSQMRMQTSLLISTNYRSAKFLIPVNIHFKWPSLRPENSSNKFLIPMTHVNESRVEDFRIYNPTHSPLICQVLFMEHYENFAQVYPLLSMVQKWPKRDEYFKMIEDAQKSKVFSLHLDKASYETNVRLKNEYNISNNLNSSLLLMLPPNESIKLKIKFTPRQLGSFSSLLLIRNNFTALESFLISAKSGYPQLRVNDQLTGNWDAPIAMEMSEKQCAEADENFTYEKAYDYLVVSKWLKITNTGNMSVTITSVSFGVRGCYVNSNSLNRCYGLTIEPNESFDFEVVYEPDFSVTKGKKSLFFSLFKDLVI